MSNHPDQPQPYPGEPASSAPGSYNAPEVPPVYQPPSQPPSQPPYQQKPQPAPNDYSGGAAYAPAVSPPQGMSLSSMIIGLSSVFIVGWFIVPQIVGIVLGHLGLKRESPQGRAFAITGLVTNYLALLIYVGIYVSFLLFFVIFASTSASEYSM